MPEISIDQINDLKLLQTPTDITTRVVELSKFTNGAIMVQLHPTKDVGNNSAIWVSPLFMVEQPDVARKFADAVEAGGYRISNIANLEIYKGKSPFVVRYKQALKRFASQHNLESDDLHFAGKLIPQEK